MIPFPVPLIQECDTLVVHILPEETGYLRITVDLHLFRHEGMLIRICRIVLGGVPFRHDGIDSQIHEQACITTDDPRHHAVKGILADHFAEDQESTDLQTAAALRLLCLVRQYGFRKIAQEICVRDHHI